MVSEFCYLTFISMVEVFEITTSAERRDIFVALYKLTLLHKLESIKSAKIQKLKQKKTKCNKINCKMEQERTFSLIGRFIHDIRKENKIKLEDLCYGICSKSFLSRIESGKVQANNLLLEALFTRLGLDFPRELVPFSKEQNHRFEIANKIDNIVDNRNPKRMELLKKYKEGSPLNKFEEQFCALTEGWYLNQFNEKLEDSLKIYEKGLKLTIPNFSLE